MVAAFRFVVTLTSVILIKLELLAVGANNSTVGDFINGKEIPNNVLPPYAP